MWLQPVFLEPRLLDAAVIKQTPAVALVQREKDKSEYETDLLKLQGNINIGPGNKIQQRSEREQRNQRQDELRYA